MRPDRDVQGLVLPVEDPERGVGVVRVGRAGGDEDAVGEEPVDDPVVSQRQVRPGLRRGEGDVDEEMLDAVDDPEPAAGDRHGPRCGGGRVGGRDVGADVGA